MQKTKELDLVSSVPPHKFERNEYGLLKGIEYIFDSDGYVDWIKMLKPEHFAPDKNKTVEKDISKIPIEELLILLPGVKYLAGIRGFYSVDYSTIHADGLKICVKCTIFWMPNYETENRTITFSSLADASLDNTDGFGQIYLTTIAENRAFIRCVRNFLRIKNVSKEELKSNTAEEVEVPASVTSPAGVLKSLMEKIPISFPAFIKKLEDEGRTEAKNWSSIDQIPKSIVLEFIGRMRKRLDERTTS